MLRILIEDSEGKSKIAPINPDTDITIGRKEGNSIRLKERNVSRYHARIYSTAEGLFVEPVAARYGLKVNSSKIDGPTPLSLGDEIRIGDYRLYLQDENQPQVQQQDPGEVVEIAPQLRPRFVVTSSNFVGTEYYVTKTRVIIGRGEQCDIHIAHQSVSGQHAEVRRTPRGDFEIRDLQSSNGTKVNNQVISEPVYLTSGDMVTLGHVIMRFCAPGDLWSLNFGHYEDRSSRMSLPIIILLFFLVAVLVSGATILVTQVLDKTNVPAPQPQAAVVSAKTQNNDFFEALTLCGAAIEKGEFELATEACERARRINPNDTLLDINQRKLTENIEADRRLDEAQTALLDMRCEDARDSLNAIASGTHAFVQVSELNIRENIDKCFKKRYFEKAMAAIENNDFDTARTLRDNIKAIDIGADEIGKIDAAIDEKRPSRGSGSSRRAQNNSDVKEEVAAAPAKPVADVKQICKDAVRAKMQKDYCKAYKLYKQAFSIGGFDANCKRNGEEHIEKYAGQCK